MTCPHCARHAATESGDVSPARAEAMTIVAYSDGTDGQTRAAAYLIAMGPEAVAEGVARAYEEGRAAGQKDQIAGHTPGDVINARARAGAAVVDAREALARIPRKETALHEAAAERLRQAESDYRAARAAEEVT